MEVVGFVPLPYAGNYIFTQRFTAFTTKVAISQLTSHVVQMSRKTQALDSLINSIVALKLWNQFGAARFRQRGHSTSYVMGCGPYAKSVSVERGAHRESRIMSLRARLQCNDQTEINADQTNLPKKSGTDRRPTAT